MGARGRQPPDVNPVDVGSTAKVVDDSGTEFVVAGPLVLVRLLPAYKRTHDRDVGTRLVSALSGSPGLRGLSSETLRETFVDYPDDVRKKLEPLLKRLEVKATEKTALMADYSPVLGHGIALALVAAGVDDHAAIELDVRGRLEAASIGNLKRTWVNGGQARDWFSPTAGEGRAFLAAASQAKTIWLPYGD